MENECHQLDLKLAQHTTGRANDRTGFVKHSKLLHELHQLEEERDKQKQHVELVDGVVTAIALQVDKTNPLTAEFQHEAVRARSKLDKLVNGALYTNPCE